MSVLLLVAGRSEAAARRGRLARRLAPHADAAHPLRRPAALGPVRSLLASGLHSSQDGKLQSVRTGGRTSTGTTTGEGQTKRTRGFRAKSFDPPALVRQRNFLGSVALTVSLILTPKASLLQTRRSFRRHGRGRITCGWSGRNAAPSPPEATTVCNRRTRTRQLILG